MTRSEFDKKWEKFKTMVVDNLATPEQVNDMKMCFVAGMVETYHYLTTEVGEMNEWNAMKAISTAGVTLQNVANEVAKEGSALLEKQHGPG